MQIKDHSSICIYCMKMCHFTCPIKGIWKDERYSSYTKMIFPSIEPNDWESIQENAMACIHCGLCTETCKHSVPVEYDLTQRRKPPEAWEEILLAFVEQRLDRHSKHHDRLWIPDLGILFYQWVEKKSGLDSLTSLAKHAANPLPQSDCLPIGDSLFLLYSMNSHSQKTTLFSKLNTLFTSYQEVIIECPEFYYWTKRFPFPASFSLWWPMKVQQEAHKLPPNSLVYLDSFSARLSRVDNDALVHKDDWPVRHLPPLFPFGIFGLLHPQFHYNLIDWAMDYIDYAKAKGQILIFTSKKEFDAFQSRSSDLPAYYIGDL